jgi:DNA-binding MarR family transcriptional regulator
MPKSANEEALFLSIFGDLEPEKQKEIKRLLNKIEEVF